MGIQDLNLGFLYEEKKGMILGKEHPFDKKWRDERVKFINYIKNTTISNYFKLILSAHSDRYPRDYWIGGSILNDKYSMDSVKFDGEYHVLDGKYLIYDELKKVKRIIKKDNNDFDYTLEYIYEFKNFLNLAQIIEESLKKKEYNKTEEDFLVTYNVFDSPLDVIVLGRDFLKLRINEDFYKYRRI